MLRTFLSGGRPIRLNFTDPPSPSPAKPIPAILLLHGAGGNVDFWFDRIAPTLARLGIAIFAVHYFDRTGTTRADPALLRDGTHVPLWIDTIRDALEHIATPLGTQPYQASGARIDPSRIALVGISLGAFLALGLVTQTPTQSALIRSASIRCIVDISGGLAPPFDTMATRDFPPTLILHGDVDPIVPVSNAHALDSLLTRLGVPHQLQILPGEGHWFSAASQARILTAIFVFLTHYL